MSRSPYTIIVGRLRSGNTALPWEVETGATGTQALSGAAARSLTSDASSDVLVTTDNILLSSYNVGERLAVICRPGYVISGQRSSVQCSPSGHWSAELPECLAWD